MTDWIFLAAGVLGSVLLYLMFWPWRRVAKPDPPGSGAELVMSVRLVGWSQTQAWAFFGCSLAVVGCLFAAWAGLIVSEVFTESDTGRVLWRIARYAAIVLVGETEQLASHFMLVVAGVAAIVALVPYPLWRLRARRAAGSPDFTVTRDGIFAPRLGNVTWNSVLSIHAARGTYYWRDRLYLELGARDSRSQRFEALCSGFGKTSFLIARPGGGEFPASWHQLAEALDGERMKYGQPGAMPSSAVSSAWQALKSGRVSEVAVLQTLHLRLLFGVYGAAITWFIANPWIRNASSVVESVRNPTAETWIALVIYGLPSLVLIRHGFGRLLQSIFGRPLLVATTSGLQHWQFGFIRWAEVERVATHAFMTNPDKPKDEIAGSYWLCAHVTRQAYHRALWRAGLLERLLVWTKRNYTKAKWALPLASMGRRGKGLSYSVNGVPIDNGAMDDIVARIDKLRPTA